MKNKLNSIKIKTSFMFFFILMLSQLALAQLTNPGRADGPRAVIPSQSAPNVITPNVVKPKPTQKCTCNPNGFNPFTYSYLGENRTVMTLNQFDVKCKTPIKLDGGYKCSFTTAVCAPTFKAVVKNGAGVVINTISPFNFPWEYQFDTAGSYTLEIIPFCSGKICQSAIFYFTVSCVASTTCKCNPKGWSTLSAVLDGEVKAVKCGDSFKIKKAQKFGIKGAYKCIGNCNSILKGTIVNTDTGETQNFESITLDGHSLDFPKPGNYKLIITPVCNDVACELCILYVTVY